MLIRSKIESKNGRVVHFPGGAVYHFKPTVKDGPHVCEVDNEEHAARLLSITEGYEPAEGFVPVAAYANTPIEADVYGNVKSKKRKGKG